ncbi:calcium/calmodulin-regulated receptor-like kinase 1 [Arachis ipaensis]|uniref:calcium/calmodulin-regulated receptor-like kinase 1 n=1 Tax=Arachis ipaensis TaxID=130454 RepID=UPI000A2B42D6|nr:calcium/calmodulin-regulated receptor-like kinase 1 [Arachis ipaensis]XP_020964624.1 calcium/calmodulin-regulated receptor-like kinase 1 [Arachis ipaensis]XP_020964625.1 calcium/calmodulin-regulated receptor-like kinase 1 [Arachis ipaensis]
MKVRITDGGRTNSNKQHKQASNSKKYYNPKKENPPSTTLAAMNTDGKVSWEEIVDSRLEGKCDFQELNEVAALAYKCINHAPRKRPSMRDIMQVLMRIAKSRHHKKSLSAATADEVSIDVDNQETKVTAVSQHRREESIDSAADMYDV